MYTHGSVSSLLVMYAINVFVTFSLTLTGMTRHWWQVRKTDPSWKNHILLQAIGAALCIGILCITIYEKAYEGGWLTIVVTAVMVVFAFRIKGHYNRVRHQLRRLDEQLLDLPVRPHAQHPEPIHKDEPVAVMLVNGFSGLGIHTVLSVQSLFPHLYKAYLFGSVAVIDSATFKGHSEIEALTKQTVSDLERYVDLAHKLGFRADYRYRIGTEAVESVVELCEEIAKEFPRSIFYLGQLVFENDRVYYKILHNETAFAIQRRLQFAGLQAIVLPIRVTEPKRRRGLFARKSA
jgi:K+ transporter